MAKNIDGPLYYERMAPRSTANPRNYWKAG